MSDYDTFTAEGPLPPFDLSGKEDVMAPCQHQPVGIVEIAERLGVPRPTVDTWRYRGKLPEPRWRLGNSPIWCWQCDISPWAERYGKQRAGLT